MKQETLAQRVENANPAELVVMMLEGLKEKFADGIEAVEEKDPDRMKTAAEQARAILTELHATLWGDSVVALQSRQLYLYLNKLVTDASNRQDKSPLLEARAVLEPLLEGWQHVAKNPPQPAQGDESAGPSVVAGMTYGKGTLKETYLSPQADRLGKG